MNQKKGGRADRRVQGQAQQGPSSGERSGQEPEAAREPAEGSRETVRTNLADDKTEGAPANRNTRHDQHGGGISNRGMDPVTEQQDLPDRGGTKETEHS
jgi:hypothetical protein